MIMGEIKFSNLDGELIYFKPLSLNDAKEIHKFASDKKVSKFIGWNLSHSLQDTISIIKDMIKKEASQAGLYASVVLKSTDEIIGTCMLFNFEPQARHADIGYVLDAGHWNKGYGTEVISIINDYALNTLNLHRLNANVTDVNIGSSRVLEKNGFLLEGSFKDYYFVDGKYYNGLFFGKILD